MSHSSKIRPVLYDAPLHLFGQEGGFVALRANKVAIKKMTIINTSGPVLINGRCIGYMLADHII